MKQEKENPLSWEAADPKVPIVRSGDENKHSR